jgi:hypothetical protein
VLHANPNVFKALDKKEGRLRQKKLALPMDDDHHAST